MLDGGPVPDVRPVIRRSWARSAGAEVDPSVLAPRALSVDQALTRWERHPARA
jgi:hypothetical protein